MYDLISNVYNTSSRKAHFEKQLRDIIRDINKASITDDLLVRVTNKNYSLKLN